MLSFTEKELSESNEISIKYYASFPVLHASDKEFCYGVSPHTSSSMTEEHEEPGYDFLDLHLQETET